jgi:hypothetical protein
MFKIVWSYRNMKFLLKVLVLVSLIVISKFTKEDAMSSNKQVANPAGFPAYSSDGETASFPSVNLPVRPTTNSSIVNFN